MHEGSGLNNEVTDLAAAAVVLMLGMAVCGSVLTCLVRNVVQMHNNRRKATPHCKNAEESG